MTNDPVSDISIPDLSFAQYVSTLTVALQARYDLNVARSVLQNDIMTLRFCEATPRQPRIRLIAWFNDENLFEFYAKSKTFFLYDYLEYRQLDRTSVFPYEGSTFAHEYARSPLQILAITIFVLNEWNSLFRGEVEEIKAFGLDYHARCVAYTARFSDGMGKG